jgi:hypothetical protein
VPSRHHRHTQTCRSAPQNPPRQAARNEDHKLIARKLGLAPPDIELPGSFVHVLGGIDLLLLVLAGLAIAIAGALGPAGWAARTGTSAVLHTE